MSDEVRDLLVLTDEAGEYYVLPREVIEGYKVAAEHKAELTDLLQPEATGFDGRITQTSAAFALAGSLRLQGFFGARAGRILGIRASPAKRASPAEG